MANVTAAGHATSRIRWPWPIAALHWATVLLLIALLTSGWTGGSHVSSSGLHASLGISLLVVLCVRIVIRMTCVAPVPVSASPVARRLGGAVQIILYAAMILSAVSGLLAISPHPFMPPPRLFGVAELHRIAPTPSMVRASAGLHSIMIWTILATAALHVAAFIYHSVFTDRRTIRRML